MTDEELLKVIEEAKARGATTLDLSNKGITTLPPEIGQLTSLTILVLSGNQLTTLPPEICQFTSLIYLGLSNNQFTTLPPEICQLTSLTELGLWGNQLTTLPPEIGQLTNLKDLVLHDNPLSSPPLEIASQGIEAIRQYFASLQPEDKPLNEVKVLLVGDGAAGKTSLVKQLLGEAFDKNEDTTHGISIRGWEVEANQQKIRVNLWDFGGQEIMHATHQFFLSMRSLYVLVLDGRRDDKTEYWLQHIERFGGKSPVLVVLNKEDSNPSFDVNRPFLQQKYPGIRFFFRTSCQTGAGIARFRDALIKELAKIEMIGTIWPGSWFRVKQRIEQMDKPYISCEEYGGICQEAGIAEEQGREVLVDFLHDLGVVVHFKDYVLNAMHVLDPVWVTNAVYKIINAKELADSQGVLRKDELTGILKQQRDEKHGYPSTTHAFIIELMKKFQLCYDLDQEAVLIPQLLPVVRPAFAFEYNGSLRFALQYHHFLPPSLFPRFMVKVHKDIKANTCWRTGALLWDEPSGTQAVVEADTEARRINLWVQGERRKEYLHFLWFVLREINASYNELLFKEGIPLADSPPVMADYQTLLRYAARPDDTYYADGSEKEYHARELLGMVVPDKEDEELELLRMIKTQLDEKESGSEAFNSLFELKPSVFGVSFNLSEAFKRILATQRGK